MNKGAENVYTCRECGGYTVTVDRGAVEHSQGERTRKEGGMATKLRIGDNVKFSQVGILERWWPIDRLSCPPEQIRGVVSKITRRNKVYVNWWVYKTPQVYEAAQVLIGLEITGTT